MCHAYCPYTCTDCVHVGVIQTSLAQLAILTNLQPCYIPQSAMIFSLAILKISVSLVLQFTVVICNSDTKTPDLNSMAMLYYDQLLQCPPGFIYNSDINGCECYEDVRITCIENEAFLNFGRCLTYEEGEGTFLALCSSFPIRDQNVTDRFYISPPTNYTELNDYMCGPINRKGIACRECTDGFSPAITSFGYQCSNCTGAWYGVPLFLFLEFIPITVFYFTVLSFGISVTTAPMSSFILFSQLAAHLFTVFIVLTTVIENEYGSSVVYFIKITTSLYGIWNLDFFRYLIPPFCISPNLNLLHVFILYYISAFYPLALIAITWCFIQLKSRNYKPLTWIWYLVKRCQCVRNQIEPKKTIIDVFATFLLLSYTKLAYTSLYFLLYVRIEKNNEPFQLVALVDPSIGYFSKSHAPFAAIAIIILFGPITLPVLLLTFYPIRAFRSLLEKCKISGHSRAALNQFVEKYHSCYRDGLEGGKDMRSFVLLPFLLRLSVFVGIVFQGEVQFWCVHFLLFGGSSLLIAIVQPYKKLYQNIIDALILTAISLTGVLYILYLNLGRENNQYSPIFLFALLFNFSLPLLGIVLLISLRLVSKIMKKMELGVKTSILNYVEQQTQQHPPNVVTITELDLPDRIVHPYRYENNDSQEAQN